MLSIVPIVSTTPETDLVHELWGTGFLLGPTLLMSAKHVLGVELPEGQRLAAVFFEPGNPQPITIDQIYLDPEFDVALGEVCAWPPGQDFLTLADHDGLAMNRGVLTVEYSDTAQNVPMPDGRRAMEFSPNYHMGHIVRSYVSKFGHDHPTSCMDLSFAAFRRASGAPVLHADNGDVLGLIVANVERHLLPAHLERIERSDESYEEIAYFVPNAQAIRANHLRDCLARGRPLGGGPSSDPNGT